MNDANHADRNLRPLFVYLGRRGTSELTFAVMREALQRTDISPRLLVSRSNERFHDFEATFGTGLIGVDTFVPTHGALTQAWRLPALRHTFRRIIEDHHVTHVIDLMPHIWTPFIISAIRQAGARYIAIGHDGRVHPGDHRTRVIHAVSNHALRNADHVIALSQAVARQYRDAGIADESRSSVLFLPDLSYGTRAATTPRPLNAPPRLAFLGRVMSYKGLSLFVETIEHLRANGTDIACGVFGEGDLGPYAMRLAALNAEVINRWLTEDEFGDVLRRYDVLVASHVEASQSGVIAAALGAGLPVAATPVGGLTEQVTDGVTGVIAEAATPDKLAEAIHRLIESPEVYAAIRGNIQQSAKKRSTAHFLAELLKIARTLPHPTHHHDR